MPENLLKTIKINKMKLCNYVANKLEKNSSENTIHTFRKGVKLEEKN